MSDYEERPSAPKRPAPIREFVGTLLTNLGLFVWAVGFFIGAAILVAAGNEWLQTAQWPNWTVDSLYPLPPPSTMKGWDQIITTAWQLPLYALFPIVGTIVGWFFGALGRSYLEPVP